MEEEARVEGGREAVARVVVATAAAVMVEEAMPEAAKAAGEMVMVVMAAVVTAVVTAVVQRGSAVGVGRARAMAMEVTEMGWPAAAKALVAWVKVAAALLEETEVAGEDWEAQKL